MNIDAELDVWRREWQSDTATVPSDLRKRVERQARWMKIALTADVLVTIVIGGATVLWALLAPQTDVVLLAVATWVFLAAAWTFRVVVHRGNWSPSGMDTADYVEFLVRRCRAALRATIFGAVLFVIEIVFCVGWIYQHNSEPRESFFEWLFSNPLTMYIVLAATVVFCVFLLWYRRKKHAELAYLENLYTQIIRS